MIHNVSVIVVTCRRTAVMESRCRQQELRYSSHEPDRQLLGSPAYASGCSSSSQCEGRCTHERDAQRRDVARRMRTNEDRAVNIQYEYAFIVL